MQGNQAKGTSDKGAKVSRHLVLIHPSSPKMAPSQGHRSPCTSGDADTMCEHQCLSSPATSSTSRDDETFSDTTLDDVLEDDEPLSPCSDTLTGSASSHSTDTSARAIFPLHLISGCSSTGRNTMCTFSRTITAEEGRRKFLELRGT